MADPTRISFFGREFVILETLGEDDIAPLFSGEWTGSRIWESSSAVAEFVKKEISEHPKKQPLVLELGSGCGLISLLACTLGAKVFLLIC